MVCICFFAPKFYYLYKIPDSQVSWDDGSKRIAPSPTNKSNRSIELPTSSSTSEKSSPKSIEMTSYSPTHAIKLEDATLFIESENESFHVLTSRTLETMANLQVYLYLCIIFLYRIALMLLFKMHRQV